MSKARAGTCSLHSSRDVNEEKHAANFEASTECLGEGRQEGSTEAQAPTAYTLAKAWKLHSREGRKAGEMESGADQSTMVSTTAYRGRRSSHTSQCP